MPRIENIDELLQRVSLVDVVSRRVPGVKRAGNNHKVKCPFHSSGNERSASLTLFPDEHWYCFGCKSTGNAIEFVKLYDNLDFVPAVELLADQSGVTLRYGRGESGPGGPSRQDLHAALDAAQAHYVKALPEHTEAVDYLHSRGFDDDRISRWGIGYARGNSVSEIAVDAETLVAAGILQKPKEGSSNQGLYDPLHGRITIPIRSEVGRVVGWTGRAMPTAASGPKYINTPETVLFRKKELLFGLDTARRIIGKRNPPYIMEGQLAAIACQESGIPAVAPGGTAFCREHAMVLRRHAGSAVVAMDLHKWDADQEQLIPDTAGRKASLDAASELQSLEMIVQFGVLQIPDIAPVTVRDPDDLLAAGLPIAYDVMTLADWGLEYVVEGSFGSAEWAASLSDVLLPIIHTQSNQPVLHALLAELAEITGIPVSALRGKTVLQEHRRQTSSPALAAAENVPMNDANCLIAMGLQAAMEPPADIDAALYPGRPENWWQHYTAPGDISSDLARRLRAVSCIRTRALRRGITLQESLSEVPDLPVDWAAEMLTLLYTSLPNPPLPEQIAKLSRSIAEREHRDRIKKGIL